MYSRKVVESRIPAVARELSVYMRETLEMEGVLEFVEPIFHSVEECDQFSDHIARKIKKHEDEVGPKKLADKPCLFDPEETLWMENERKLCQIDYLYFARRYAIIQNSEEEMIHYNPNFAQLIVNDARAELEDLGWAIMMMWLKGRQAGITTDSQVIMAHRTFFHPNVIALTGSSDKERSREMVDKYKALYDHMPSWLVPSMDVDRAGTRMEFGALNSKLIVQHGNQKYDIGRGNTPSAVHLSEVATYVNAAKLIDGGLIPAVHESPRKIVILESTGEGPFGWWYDTWEKCKRFYWKGQAKFRPGFLPWFVATDFYPTETWLKRCPVPVDWSPLSITIAHAESAKKYVMTNDLLRKHFPENWKMPRHQMYFWEVMRADYKRNNELSKFLREHAANDLESFAASGESVFDVETIDQYQNNCPEPLVVYGFRAAPSVIPPRIQADETQRDHSKPVVDLGPYQLIPVKWEGWSTSDVTGKLLVFEWPEEGAEYGFGVDTADGIGLDNTALEGMRKGDLNRNHSQVCEFASNYINALDFAPIVHATALFYQGNSHRQPKIAIETGLNGELTQLELRKYGWANFHLWIRYDRKRINPKDASRVGFVTNRWSRPMVLDLILQALRNGDLDVNSREFVKEMQSLHRDENVQMARASAGHNDDRFMAMGIIFLSMQILELTGKQKNISYLRQQRERGGPVRYEEALCGDEPVLLPGSVKPFGHREPFEKSTRLRDFFAGTAAPAYFTKALVHPGGLEEDSWEKE